MISDFLETSKNFQLKISKATSYFLQEKGLLDSQRDENCNTSIITKMNLFLQRFIHIRISQPKKLITSACLHAYIDDILGNNSFL